MDGMALKQRKQRLDTVIGMERTLFYFRCPVIEDSKKCGHIIQEMGEYQGCRGYGNPHMDPHTYGNGMGMEYDFPLWGSTYGYPHIEISMGIPTDILWEWEWKLPSHGNPGH